MPTTYAIPNGRTVFEASTYTGTGSALSVANTDTATTGFQPDLVWVKNRSATSTPFLVDSIRGSSQILVTNGTGAQQNLPSYVTGFNTNGFGIGTGSGGSATDVNTSGNNYVGWQWQAGAGTSSSNTNGTITSTVSVNQAAGFSIVKYTGNGTTGATIGHGLGATPAFIMVKDTSSSVAWIVYHTYTGNTAYTILNSNVAVQTSINAWNNTSPTSSVFTVAGAGTATNTSGETYIAYCWAQVPGFSSFGSVTTNSSGGGFIYTGFRPAFFMTKRTDSTSNWNIYDAGRNTFNATNDTLFADNPASEYTTYPIDFLSNGVNIINGSYAGSAQYLYVAFGVNPLKYANAR